MRKLIFSLMILSLFFSNSAHALFPVVPEENVSLYKVQETHQELDFRKVNLLVWNIFKTNRPEAKQDLKKLLQKSNLALLQESYLSFPFLHLLTQFPLMQAHMALGFVDSYGFLTGVMNISNGKAHESFSIQSKEKEPIVKTPKMILAQKFKHPHITNMELLVLNIHALNFVTNSQFESQLWQTQILLSEHIGPIIFAGDFNTWNTGRLVFLDRYLNSFGLSRIPIKQSSYLVLDHIYIRGFKHLNALALENITSSDHTPLFVELSLE